MDFTVKTTDVLKSASPCLVIGAFQEKNKRFTSSGEAIDSASDRLLTKLAVRGELNAELGSTLLLYDLKGVKAGRVLVVGLGERKKFDAGRLRQSIIKVVRTLDHHAIKSADFTLTECTFDDEGAYRMTRHIVEAAEQAQYNFHKTKSTQKKSHLLNKIGLRHQREQASEARRAVKHASAIAAGVSLACDLSNMPGNICTPRYLAEQAKSLQKQYPISTTILDEADMKRKKMGVLLSVSKGSKEPARLIVMHYNNGRRGEKPIVLVGKGVTFDAGGISLKPATSMEEMKYDMCGGASVFGVMKVIAEMEYRVNVVGIVPSCENLPDGAANKPGDVVTSMSGTTVEIVNTDAEGRLLLCDALTYAQRFKPEVVIDIATLTGACVIALGEHASGLFCEDDELADSLLAAGDASCDRAWRMPMWDDYNKQLKSNSADISNMGGRSAGAITAACFLKHFAKKYTWAHLDIAGTAWKSGANRNATGRPVPLLVEYLLSR